MLQETDKDCTILLLYDVVALYANVERIFLGAATNLKEREFFMWTSFWSIKAGVQFKTSFMEVELILFGDN